MSAAHASSPLPEPKTPMWLPAVGAALFVLAAIWWAVTPSAPSQPPADAAASATANAAAPTATQQAPQGQGSPLQRGPAGNPAAMQQLLDQIKQQQPAKK